MLTNINSCCPLGYWATAVEDISFSTLLAPSISSPSNFSAHCLLTFAAVYSDVPNINLLPSYLIRHQVLQVKSSFEPGRWIWMKRLPEQWKVSEETTNRAMPFKSGIGSYTEESMKVVGRIVAREECYDSVLVFCIGATGFLLLWRNNDKAFCPGSVGGIRTSEGRSGDINVDVRKVDDIGSVETEPKMGGMGDGKTWISNGVWKLEIDCGLEDCSTRKWPPSESDDSMAYEELWFPLLLPWNGNPRFRDCHSISAGLSSKAAPEMIAMFLLSPIQMACWRVPCNAWILSWVVTLDGIADV